MRINLGVRASLGVFKNVSNAALRPPVRNMAGVSEQLQKMYYADRQTQYDPLVYLPNDPASEEALRNDTKNWYASLSKNERNMINYISHDHASEGALSPEAHHTIRTTWSLINHVHHDVTSSKELAGKKISSAGSGEGGEDTNHNSSIFSSLERQFATSKHGVDIHYLQAPEVLIKIAQSAKAIFGGQVSWEKLFQVSRYVMQRGVLPKNLEELLNDDHSIKKELSVELSKIKSSFTGINPQDNLEGISKTLDQNFRAHPILSEALKHLNHNDEALYKKSLETIADHVINKPTFKSEQAFETLLEKNSLILLDSFYRMLKQTMPKGYLHSSNNSNLSVEEITLLLKALHAANDSNVGVKIVSSTNANFVAAAAAKCLLGVSMDGGIRNIDLAAAPGGTGAAPVGTNTLFARSLLPAQLQTAKVLKEQGIRKFVQFRVSGGIENGRQLAMVHLLGADQARVVSSSMVGVGCEMFRVCHQNTCGVGVATSDPVLRSQFRGSVNGLLKHIQKVFLEPAAKQFEEWGINDPDNISDEQIRFIMSHADDVALKKLTEEWLLTKNPYEGKTLEKPYEKDGRIDQVVDQVEQGNADIHVKSDPRQAVFPTHVSGLISRDDLRLGQDTLIRVNGHGGAGLHAFSHQQLHLLADNASDHAHLCGLGSLHVKGTIGFKAGEGANWGSFTVAGTAIGNKMGMNAQGGTFVSPIIGDDAFELAKAALAVMPLSDSNQLGDGIGQLGQFTLIVPKTLSEQVGQFQQVLFDSKWIDIVMKSLQLHANVANEDFSGFLKDKHNTQFITENYQIVSTMPTLSQKVQQQSFLTSVGRIPVSN